MIIDIDERCKNLDIKWDAYSSAVDKIDRVLFDSPNEPPFDKYESMLTHDELIAVIRWDNLHIRYPDLFTWDGAK